MVIPMCMRCLSVQTLSVWRSSQTLKVRGQRRQAVCSHSERHVVARNSHGHHMVDREPHSDLQRCLANPTATHNGVLI